MQFPVRRRGLTDFAKPSDERSSGHTCSPTAPKAPMRPVHRDPTLCTVEGSAQAGSASYMRVPSFDGSDADREAEANMEFDMVSFAPAAEALDSAFHLFGAPSAMKACTAESAEVLIREDGPRGLVFNYYPSVLERVKRMSIQEKIARLASLNEKISEHCKFEAETGRIMANFWEDVDPDEQHFEKLTQSFEEGSTT